MPATSPSSPAAAHAVFVLQTRHRELEQRITEEYQRPLPDADLVTQLKVAKLRIKEQIERVKAS